MDFEKIKTFVSELIASFGLKLLMGILILVVGVFIIKKIKKFLRESKKLSRIDDSIRYFFASFATIALYIILFVTTAAVLGVPITSFLTVLASCGVAIGLALQGAFSNFAGGMMILFFKPFKVGDYIKVSGDEGTVAEITVVYTILLTVDNKRITIPNGSLTNSVIINYSAEDNRRVDLTFNTSYSCDIETTKKIINRVIEKNPAALKTPEPFVRLSNHKDSSLEYTVRVWCKKEDYWDVYFYIIENVKKEFDKEGIEIPFPQMDVHVKPTE